MYKIILADGRVLNDIEVNDTTLVSKTPIDESYFANNLSPVDIELVGDRDYTDNLHIEGHHDNMMFQMLDSPIEGQHWFILRDVPEMDIRFAKLQADIEYLSMMTDIEL